MREWDRIACDARIRLAPVKAHASSPDAGTPFRGEFQVFSTSGASGVRGVFSYEAAAWAESIGFIMRGLIRMGARPDSRIVGIGAPGRVHMSKRIFAVFEGARSDSPRLSVLTPLEEAVDALNAFQPEIVFGYPSYVGRRAAEQLAGRLRIAPRFVAVGSEPVTEDVRTLTREAWTLECGEYYGATELALIAGSSASHPRVLELSEDLAVIEVVDERTASFRPGPPARRSSSPTWPTARFRSSATS